MATPSSKHEIWRFGVYEVDTRKFELCRAGTPLKLREQSFQILLHLLEHAGEVVTREELRQILWPADTFVDFDHSLSTAMMKLRDALGDSTETPVYIETIPKRGYRFIAPVSRADASNGLMNWNGDPVAPSVGAIGPLLVVPSAARSPDFKHWWRGRPNLRLPFENREDVSGLGEPPASVARYVALKWFSAGALIACLVVLLIGLAVRKLAQPYSVLPVVKTVIKLEPGLRLDGNTPLAYSGRCGPVIPLDVGH